MGSIKHSLAITKYKMVPLIATGKYKFLDLLIYSSRTEFAYKSFSTYLDFVFDCSRVVMSSTSSKTIPVD